MEFGHRAGDGAPAGDVTAVISAGHAGTRGDKTDERMSRLVKEIVYAEGRYLSPSRRVMTSPGGAR